MRLSVKRKTFYTNHLVILRSTFLLYVITFCQFTWGTTSKKIVGCLSNDY